MIIIPMPIFLPSGHNSGPPFPTEVHSFLGNMIRWIGVFSFLGIAAVFALVAFFGIMEFLEDIFNVRDKTLTLMSGLVSILMLVVSLLVGFIGLYGIFGCSYRPRRPYIPKNLLVVLAHLISTVTLGTLAIYLGEWAVSIYISAFVETFIYTGGFLDDSGIDAMSFLGAIIVTDAAWLSAAIALHSIRKIYFYVKS